LLIPFDPNHAPIDPALTALALREAQQPQPSKSAYLQAIRRSGTM
jgi:hypothetical protein